MQKLLKILSDTYNVNLNWLLSGEEPMFKSEEKINTTSNFGAAGDTSLQHKIKELESDVRYWKGISEERKATIAELQKSLDTLRDAFTNRSK
jgi:hypothetical protein